MGVLLSPDVARLIIAAIIVAMVIGCLCVVGSEFHKSLRRHDLRVRVHNLRLEQRRRLDQIAQEADRGSKHRKLPSIAGTVGPTAAEAVEAPHAEAA